MSLIAGDGVGKNYGAGYIFENLSFALDPADRVGLVGPNGQGKTTLLRLIAGLEEASAGTFGRKKGLRVGYLPQDAPVLPGVTLWQFMLDAFADLKQMETQMHALAEALSEPEAGQELLARYGAIQHEFERRGGYGYHTRIETVLTGLGFDSSQYQHGLSQLSGGQRSRAMLASLLLEEPEVLLLDEPTSHLDLEATEWLERWLESFHGAIIVVSHDRFFLDNVAGSVWEMSAGKLESYRGNYTAYNRQRLERLAERQKRYAAQQEFIERTEEFIRRNVGAKRVNVAQGRKTRLERFKKDEAIERPLEQDQIRLRFKDIPRSGEPVFRTEALCCGYGRDKPLLDMPDVDVYRGQHVAIIGANGVGKTTLLRTLMGALEPLSGKVRRGANVAVGYLAQTHDKLKAELTAVQTVREADPSLTPEQARALLGGLLLSGDEAMRPIEQLSGGQRSRVVLAKLVAQKANVLLLDEPTNHLDLPSQEALQEVLAAFPGTVLMVTHDRYLVRVLAGRIWALDDGGVTVVAGGWEEYQRYRLQRAAAASDRQVQRQETSVGRQAHRESRRQTNLLLRLQRRQQEIEKDVQEMEARLTDLGHRISAAGQEGDLDKVHDLGRQYQQAEQQLRRTWDDWTILTEELDSLGSDSAGQ